MRVALGLIPSLSVFEDKLRSKIIIYGYIMPIMVALLSTVPVWGQRPRSTCSKRSFAPRSIGFLRDPLGTTKLVCLPWKSQNLKTLNP